MLDNCAASAFHTNTIVRFAEGAGLCLENHNDDQGMTICKGVPHHLGQDCSSEQSYVDCVCRCGKIPGCQLKVGQANGTIASTTVAHCHLL